MKTSSTQMEESVVIVLKMKCVLIQNGYTARYAGNQKENKMDKNEEMFKNYRSLYEKYNDLALYYYQMSWDVLKKCEVEEWTNKYLMRKEK